MVAWSGGVFEIASAFIFIAIVAGGFFLSIVYQYLHDDDADFVPTRTERDAVHLTAIFACTASTFVFGSQVFPNELWMNISMLFMMYFASFYLFNHYFDKASMHVGMYTLWVLIISQLVDPALGILLLGLLPVAWSRLELQRHTWPQILFGLMIASPIGALAWLTLA